MLFPGYPVHPAHPCLCAEEGHVCWCLHISGFAFPSAVRVSRTSLPTSTSRTGIGRGRTEKHAERRAARHTKAKATVDITAILAMGLVRREVMGSCGGIRQSLV